jgi:asparagine synthase (glutamine-hydrolysing)
MADALAWRGPDGTSVWVHEQAAIVHTLFRTTDESRQERQPVTGDGRFHLAGDVRLDSRADLITSLNRQGRQASAAIPDPELVMHAWLLWREACVDHVRGDFSFAVWDAIDRRLFAARDPFGVRPFYYAVTDDGLIWSNTLAAIRRHPSVTDDLDDEAIIDQLVFGHFERPASTAFAGIKRLPGGHALTWQGGRLDVRRYWAGLSAHAVRFAREADYVDRYRELFARSIEDRLRTPHVAVAMTGGLDSSSIAAVAARLFATQGIRDGVRAHTIVYDRLIPDREREFAGAVANHIGIPVTFTAADDRAVYDRLDDPSLLGPEPVDDPFRAMLTDFYRSIARQDRVLLMGLDGDTFLCETASDYLLGQLRRGRLGEYLRGVTGWMRTRRSLPPHRLRTTLRRLVGRRQQQAELDPPPWIAPAMRQRFDIAARWRAQLASIGRMAKGWPVRARVAMVLNSPIWRSMFDQHDAECLGAALEVRYPFADLELATFLFNIPAVPWCIDKRIAREAMRGWLPAQVLERSKAPLAGDTVRARLALGDPLPGTGEFHPHPRLARYVDAGLLQDARARKSAAASVYVETRPLMLNEWLWYHFSRS